MSITKALFKLSSKQLMILAVVLGLEVVATTTLYLLITLEEKEILSLDFESTSKELISSIEEEISLNLETLVSIKSLYSVTDSVSREQFRVFNSNVLNRINSIKALSWIQKVKHEEKDLFESIARKEGLSQFQITEKLNGSMIPVTQREVYYPVFYIEPLAGNEEALGFDLASDITRLSALEKAIATGDFAATARTMLVQEKNVQKSILVFCPLIKQGAQVELFTGVIRIRDLIDRALKNLVSKGCNLSIYDISAEEGNQFLAQKKGEDAPRINDDANYSKPMTLHYQQKIKMADREWMILCTPTQFYLNSFPNTALLVLIICFIVSIGILYTIYRFQLNRILEHAEALRLKEISNFKSRLYTNITHEFRTPLTIILGMSEQILANPKDWFLDGLSLIRRNGRQLLHLVNQMLDLNKLESGSLKLNMIQSDIIYYLKYIVESFDSYAESKGIQLQFLGEDDQLIMDYDPPKMLHILSNLITNAIKYSKEGGIIYISTSSWKKSQNDPYQFDLRVRDNGIGIAPEQIPRIFDRFYQADTSDVWHAEGTGIGLALTKELVKLMDGTIKVKSQLGKGSKFTVSLPIKNEAELTKIPEEKEIKIDVLPFAEQVANNVEDQSKAIADANLPLVLVIDDNSDVIQYIASCLQPNYQLVSASNGKLGIERAIQLIPDIIISDIMMPEKDGFEVSQTLKEDERTGHIPIVLLSAKTDMESRITGLKTGANIYLSKPFNPEELHVRLDNIIEQRKKLQVRYQKIMKGTFADKKQIAFEDTFLQKMRLLVEKNLTDARFDIKSFAHKAGISRVQLFRKIKALTNKSPSIFVRTIRLQKAKSLLLTTNLHISEIAYDVGFNDPAFFSRTFRDEYGTTPSEFREEQGN